MLCRCNQRTVKKAYHVCCKDCAKKERICAKCLSSADKVTIEPPEATPGESQLQQVEVDRLLKSLSERKRRTFLRFMKKGKAVDCTDQDGDENTDEVKSKKKHFVPHNREDLLNKIESLKLADEEDDDDFSFGESDLDSDFENIDGDDLSEDDAN